jgi:N6-adenosine-specific RNA methylase IME4
MCAWLAGVALGYSQLTDSDILELPVPRLQAAGFLFVWVINAKYKFTLDLFERWGYTCAAYQYSSVWPEFSTEKVQRVP